MDFFEIKTLEETKNILQEMASKMPLAVEKIPLQQARTRVIASPIVSNINIPDFNRSTVDGFAVHSSDCSIASESMPSFLKNSSQMSEMGKVCTGKLNFGMAMYVPTGGMLPEGADAMVMIENTKLLDDGTLLIYKPAAVGQHVTQIGDDVEIGETLFMEGHCLDAYDVGLLAGLGIDEVAVVKKPIVSVISTGDEIVSVAAPYKKGLIRDMNGYALTARIESLGGIVASQIIVKDQLIDLIKALTDAVKISDLVVLSGGSSVGAKDYTAQAIQSFNNGEVYVHGMAIKPGKPTIVGKIENTCVIGLPGHPVSAIMVFEMLGVPYIHQRQGKAQGQFKVKAQLTSNVHASPGKDTIQLVKVFLESETLYASPLYAKSGIMSSLTRASGFIKIDGHKEGVLKGDWVDVYLLREGIVL